MNLEETLRKMKENEKTFYPLVEGMKRRADKGLLEDVTSEDIDYYVNKIEKDTVVVEDHININQEIFELNEAIKKFDYMDFDSWSEEELETAILYEFLNDISLMEESDYYDEYEKEQLRKRRRRIAAGAAIGGTALTGATYGTIKHGNNVLTNLKNTAMDKAGNTFRASAELEAKAKAASEAGKKLFTNPNSAEAIAYGNSQYAGIIKPVKDAHVAAAGNNAIAGKTALGQGLKSIGSNIGKGISTAWNGVKKFAAANPGLAGVIGGVGLAGLGYGAYKLIKHYRKKRQESLSEAYYSDSCLFTDDVKNIIQEMVNTLSIEELNYLKENASEDTKEILSLFEKQPEVLDESVTFIDNAGNLKTMSTPDYVKDQHEYHTETQISKYEKKKKKRYYKLISEEIDIDNIKKLSEMSLEDILNEEWN